MRWGYRKARSASQNKNGSNSKSKEKYVSTNHADIAMYGHRGANKIKKSMVEKGYTHKKAEKRYRAGKLAATYSLAAAVVPVAVGAAFYGKKALSKATINSGKKVADSILKKKFNMEVMDASGKVIKRYRDAGVRVVSDMLER